MLRNNILNNTQGLGNYRWRICFVLFLATTINYIDRNVLSFTMLDDHFRHFILGIKDVRPLTEQEAGRFKELMGYVDAAFKFAYALGFLVAGYIMDRIGTRKGFSVALGIWSFAGILTGFAGSVKSLSISRIILGIGESGNFPAAIKTVAEWFPKKERSFATGVFNAGANVGVIITAFAIPYLTLQYGWRTAFIVTGALGFIVLLLWRYIYQPPQQHTQLAAAELQYIQADGEPPMKNEPWIKLLGYRQTWAFATAKLLADPIWYFFLTWLPDFFNSNEALEQKLDFKTVGIPFLIIYLVSDFGSVFFGWLSSYLIKQGWTVNRARKVTMLLCALCVSPIVFASVTHNIYIAIALIALATAAHQGWSANVYTLASDMFPKRAVASVVGIGSMMGALGGVLFAASCGVIRVKFGYMPLFAIAGSSYLLAIAIVHLLVPRLQPVNSNRQETNPT